MTARLVAVGSVASAFHTMTVQYAAGEPLWHPQLSGDEPEMDADLYRKQQVEADIAWGND